MSEPDSSALGIAPTKRPRPVISCLECRRKKLKCSRTHPCQQCIKIGRPGRCEYQAGQEPEANVNYLPAHPVSSKRPRLLPPLNSTGPETSLNRTDAGKQAPLVAAQGVVEDLQQRVARLEQALLAGKQPSNDSSLLSLPSPDELYPMNAIEDSTSLTNSSQLSSQFSDACTLMTKLRSASSDPRMLKIRTDLKKLHNLFENNHHRRLNQGVIASSAQRRPLQLPPFEVCEKLAILYFDNLEHCFRILHWPEFRNQLRIYFADGEHACRFGFIPQLIGVLSAAVGLGTHKECEAAASCSAIKPPEALRLMENFLQELPHGERYRLPALQVRMLVLICKWLNLGSIDHLFRLSGELLRDALIMRMNQDPSTLPGISVFEGEIRRRNWMTIIEVDLMLSLLCKMPSMIPPYTSKPPRNINDEELFEGMQILPASRPIEEWTDGLCQHLLAQSFQLRVTACLRIENMSHVKVEDVLPYTRRLEKFLQELPPPLRFNYLGDEASKTPSRLMARMELDISIRRPLMYLYLRCVLSLGVHGVQREIRAGYLQSCLMIVNYQDLFDPLYSELDVPRPHGYWDFFYSTYSQELGQAILGICLEINHLSAADRESHVSATSGSSTRGHLYTQEVLINALVDTLEPMKRRLPYRASKLMDIVYYEIMLVSLTPELSEKDKEEMMIQRLQILISDCRAELDRALVQNVATPDQESDAETTCDGHSTMSVKFHPLWESFPSVDIF